MNICYIYKATNNITTKSYIGFTTTCLNTRKIQHKHKALVKQIDTKFYKSIRKHGWDNFTWDILYASWDKDHCLKSMEPYFISKYDSLVNGYNTVEGGTVGAVLIGEMNGMFGKRHSEATKQIISNKRKGKGHSHTLEHRQSMIGNDNNALRRKPVIKTKDGVVIDTYKSCREASIKENIDLSRLIRNIEKEAPIDGHLFLYALRS